MLRLESLKIYFSYQFFVGYGACEYFLLFVACLLILFPWSFTEQEFLILMRSNLLVFSFIDYAFGVKSEKSV